MPVIGDHRKEVPPIDPTTTDPSPETSEAELPQPLPRHNGNPTMPPASVHKKACGPPL